MTLSKSALLKSAYSLPAFCIVSLALTAPVLGADSSQKLDELFDSAESLVPTEKPTSPGKRTSSTKADSDSLIPSTPTSFADHLAESKATVPPPPSAIEAEADILGSEISEPANVDALSEPQSESDLLTETEIEVETEATVEADVESETAVEQEKVEAPKLDPAIELLRLREESSTLKAQLLLIDSTVAERDVKIGELQEEIAKITDERNAISNELQRTKMELNEQLQMLRTKSQVLEQSIQQQVQMQQEQLSRQASREARYKGVVNRYLEPGVEYITPTYFE